MGKKAETNVTPEVQAILSTDSSKSQKMKDLFGLGLEIKAIADIMTQHEGKLVRYNFVYNVISNYCNMNGITMNTVEKAGKKDDIIRMFLAGKSNKEISIDLKTNSTYVYNVIKTYKLANPEVKPEAAGE